MRAKVILIIVLTTISNIAFTQSKTIKGKVVSGEDKQGIPGATVLVKGTVRGTTTDIDGNYSLSDIMPKDTLKFSYIGFESHEVPVGNQSVIDVEMSVSAKVLEEVVVTALGIKRQQREIGYSTERIESDIVVRSNSPNILNAIIGRVAGVQVSQGDGIEGGSTRIVIRGNNT